MLASIPVFAPSSAIYAQPVAINPTSIEMLVVQCLLSDSIVEPESTAHRIEAISMQYIQLDATPLPELVSTNFAIETIFIQYMERA